MKSKSSIRRLKFCNFKLEALLEITNAINANLKIDELINKYESILNEDLDIGKLLVFANQTSWKVVSKYGENDFEYSNINIEKDLLKYNEITTISSTENKNLVAFDFIIPVFHDQKAIAFVLIGDVEEEQEGVSPTIKHLHFIQTLTNVIFVAIENRRLYFENIKQESLKKEMELASHMQNMLVPNTNLFPNNKYIALESFYLPHYEVGGDYYDFEEISENEFFFCIADVSGKGIPAALLMSNFQANLKAYLRTGINLTQLIHVLNDKVIENAQGEKFITIFVAKYNYQTRELSYINAGHNPPLLYDKITNKHTFLTEGSPGVGMLDKIPFINEGSIKIGEQAKLICFTDGLAELENENNEEIGIAELKNCITNKSSINTNLERLKNRLNLEKSNPTLFDDITILGVDFF